MSLPIIYANVQYIAGQHLFKTIPNGNNLSLTALANAPTCNVMTLINGNIGMGTTLPLQAFHVQTPSYFVGNIGLGTTLSLQSLHVQNQSYFVGNVGLGTTRPLQALHVQNSSYFVGNVGIGTSQMIATLHANGDILSPVLVGQIAYFASNSEPLGWLECNGRTINRSIYANLFSTIGTTFGVGDNISTFGIPELRGEFIRGWDDGRGIDTSRVFGSSQTAAMINHTHTGTTNAGEGTHTHTITDPGHNHTYTKYNTSYASSPANYNMLRNSATRTTGSATTGITIDTTNSAHTHTMTTGNPSTGGGTETRPRNVALLACIKY